MSLQVMADVGYLHQQIFLTLAPLSARISALEVSSGLTAKPQMKPLYKSNHMEASQGYTNQEIGLAFTPLFARMAALEARLGRAPGAAAASSIPLPGSSRELGSTPRYVDQQIGIAAAPLVARITALEGRGPLGGSGGPSGVALAAENRESRAALFALKKISPRSFVSVNSPSGTRLVRSFVSVNSPPADSSSRAGMPPLQRPESLLRQPSVVNQRLGASAAAGFNLAEFYRSLPKRPTVPAPALRFPPAAPAALPAAPAALPAAPPALPNAPPPALPNAPPPALPNAPPPALPNVASVALGRQLHAAIQNENVEESLRLIEAGADLSLVDEESGNTALIAACLKPLVPVALAILSKPGVDVNARNNSDFTALMIASEGASTELVKAILDKGADLHADHGVFGPALFWAIRMRQPENAIELINRGAVTSNDLLERARGVLGWHTQDIPEAREKMEPVLDLLKTLYRDGGRRRTKSTTNQRSKKQRKTKHRRSRHL